MELLKGTICSIKFIGLLKLYNSFHVANKENLFPCILIFCFVPLNSNLAFFLVITVLESLLLFCLFINLCVNYKTKLDLNAQEGHDKMLKSAVLFEAIIFVFRIEILYTF